MTRSSEPLSRRRSELPLSPNPESLQRTWPMAITDDIHHVHLLIRGQDPTPLWHWDPWREVAARLHATIASARQRALLRSIQHSKARRKAVGFSTLRWSDKDHQKWTHRSPRTQERSDDWLFATTHACTPSWVKCVEQDQAPDVYVELTARKIAKKPVEVFLVSVSNRLERSSGSVVEAMRWVWQASAEPLLAAVQIRPYIFRRHTALVRSVEEVTHLELNLEAWTVEALQAATAKVDARSRVETGTWSSLDLKS